MKLPGSIIFAAVFAVIHTVSAWGAEWQTEWERTVEEAKKEGTVVFATAADAELRPPIRTGAQTALRNRA